MFVANNREFSDAQVLEFQDLRLAMRQEGNYSGGSKSAAFKEYCFKNEITLGQLVALEAEHDRLLDASPSSVLPEQ